jgi:hypothetical protein
VSDDTERACRACGHIKPLEAYRRGRRSCRACEAAYTRRHRATRPPVEVTCIDCGKLRRVRNERKPERCVSCAARVVALRTGSRPPPAQPRLSPEERHRRRRERRREGKRRAREERAAQRYRVFVVGRCFVCTEWFTWVTTSDHGPSMVKFCSPACRQQHRQRGKRSRRTIPASVRRRVFERNRWTCKLCGRRVAWSKSWPHPRSPVVDHVVPLANGGADEEWNMQCAHHECNAEKLHYGQLALVG